MEDWDPFADPADTGEAEASQGLTIDRWEANDAEPLKAKGEDDAILTLQEWCTRVGLALGEQAAEDAQVESVAEPGPDGTSGAEKGTEECTERPPDQAPDSQVAGADAADEQGNVQASLPRRTPFGRKGFGKGKGTGRGAWLLGLVPDPVPGGTAEEGAQRGRHCTGGDNARPESEAGEATPPAQQPELRPKLVETEEEPLETPKVEETRIMCEVDPNEIAAWRELFFKLGEVEETPAACVSSADPEHGTWGEQGSLARLLRREGLDMPALPTGSASSDSHTEPLLQRPQVQRFGPRLGRPPARPTPTLRSRRGAG
ncbi:unnamed protein product [Effrenium voratum]|nr:unnamed protein product [Effrenium voratum]